MKIFFNLIFLSFLSLGTFSIQAMEVNVEKGVTNNDARTRLEEVLKVLQEGLSLALPFITQAPKKVKDSQSQEDDLDSQSQEDDLDSQSKENAKGAINEFLEKFPKKIKELTAEQLNKEIAYTIRFIEEFEKDFNESVYISAGLFEALQKKTHVNSETFKKLIVILKLFLQFKEGDINNIIENMKKIDSYSDNSRFSERLKASLFANTIVGIFKDLGSPDFFVNNVISEFEKLKNRSYTGREALAQDYLTTSAENYDAIINSTFEDLKTKMKALFETYKMSLKKDDALHEESTLSDREIITKKRTLEGTPRIFFGLTEGITGLYEEYVKKSLENGKGTLSKCPNVSNTLFQDIDNQLKDIKKAILYDNKSHLQNLIKDIGDWINYCDHVTNHTENTQEGSKPSIFSVLQEISSLYTLIKTKKTKEANPYDSTILTNLITSLQKHIESVFPLPSDSTIKLSTGGNRTSILTLIDYFYKKLKIKRGSRFRRFFRRIAEVFKKSQNNVTVTDPQTNTSITIKENKSTDTRFLNLLKNYHKFFKT